MKIEIEQLMELEEGKTYYIMLSESATLKDIQSFVEIIEDLDLNSKFIIGLGEFDIEKMPFDVLFDIKEILE